MHRIGYLAVLSALAVMGQDSYDVCMKCNRNAANSAPQDLVNFYHPRLRAPLPIQEVSHSQKEGYTEEAGEQGGLNRDDRNLFPEYRSLCEYVTRRVRLDDTEYEYQPPHYHEVYCKSYSSLSNDHSAVSPSTQKCVHPGFHCVQRSKTMLLVRRRWDSECWEPFAKEVASGCDCMWPVSALGDIADHY